MSPVPGPQRRALVMAGGTGGHIFPGLAVAEALRERGWAVTWLGHPAGMEARLVPPRGFPMATLDLGGLRGKGLWQQALMPLRLLRALGQAMGVLRRVRPQVVIGMGGYISFPLGWLASWFGPPLLVHEQNAVAGLVNRVLARRARGVFTAFPGVLPGGQWVGNPLRAAFVTQPAPAIRLAGRSGRLKLLVLGGSLGAKALNDLLPQALARLPVDQRPEVTHQSGQAQFEALQAAYAAAGVTGTLLPFIDDTASAMAEADLVICRAGASTVTELAAVGVAALLVPFPFAVDDHQTHNARFLVEAGAGQVLPQAGLTPQGLADRLAGLDRGILLRWAEAAHRLRRVEATDCIVQVCEGWVAA